MVELDDLRSLAARVAAHADLQQVRLFNIDGTLDQIPSESDAFGYTFDTDLEVQHVIETQSLIVDATFTLVVDIARPGDDADTEAEAANRPDDEHLVRLSFQLAALYLLPDYQGTEPFPDEELDAFGKTTGRLALYPYARELVSNMTGRMGLPALHLATARIPLDKRNLDHDQSN